jgi:hypothetical protein
LNKKIVLNGMTSCCARTNTKSLETNLTILGNKELVIIILTNEQQNPHASADVFFMHLLRERSLFMARGGTEEKRVG